MPQVSYATARRIVADLGHTNVRVVRMRSGSFFRAECDCGYRSTRRALESDAVGAAVHHMELVADGGWDRPRPGGGDSPAAVTRGNVQRREEAAAQRLLDSREELDTPAQQVAS